MSYTKVDKAQVTQETVQTGREERGASFTDQRSSTGAQLQLQKMMQSNVDDANRPLQRVSIAGVKMAFPQIAEVIADINLSRG